MDTLISLYTTTDGRISRKQWWLGILGLIAISIAVLIVLSLISMGSATVLGWASLIANIALLYPYYCLSLKRRHDRDNDGKDVLILLGGSVVLNLLTALGIGMTMTDIGGGVMMPAPPLWMSILQIAYAIFGLYMLVQLGFLKGTAGSNSYGPDPLG